MKNEADSLSVASYRIPTEKTKNSPGSADEFAGEQVERITCTVENAF